jgi:predicted MFS family arabinose efflux permease
MKKTTLLRMAVCLILVVTAPCYLAVSFPSIFILRAFQGLGFGAISTICSTLAADYLPDARRGEGIGYYGMGSSAMIALGPATGIFIMEHFGFLPTFIASSCGMLLALSCLLTFRSEPKLAARPPAKINRGFTDIMRGFGNRIFDPALKLQAVLLLLFGICRAAEQSFLPLLAVDQAIKHFSYYYISQTVISFFTKYFTGKLYDRRGHTILIIVGGIGILLSLVVMSYSHTTGGLLIASVFSGIGMGTLSPTIQTWSLTSVAADRRSVASAVHFNFYDIGIGTGSIILGFVVTKLGYPLTFRSTCISMILFLIIYIAATIHKKRTAH